MPTDDLQTVLFPSDSLGLVRNYDRTVLARISGKESLHAGRVFLRVTLEDMIKIRSMSKSLDQNHKPFLRETRAKYDE